jgi:3-hydroxyacyl-[acyl-carrier-protein] dehydratase
MTEEVKKSLSSADIIEIMKLLPHRYPFLLVDKIIEIDGDDSAIGIKNVTANEPHFTGHFPEKPIMPGVLLVEGMAQTAGAICAKKEGEGGNLVYFMTIDNARFRKPVVPGDRVEFHVGSKSSAATSGNSIATPRLTARSSPKPISVR